MSHDILEEDNHQEVVVGKEGAGTGRKKGMGTGGSNFPTLSLF